MSNLNVLLEDTWTSEADGDADDVIEYCSSNNITCTIMSPTDIFNLDSNKFFTYIFMCDTLIVKHHLEKLNRADLIPDTYEQIYSELFGREIKKIKFCEVKVGTFVKPISNDKQFSGQICYEVRESSSFIGDVPDKDEVVYNSEIINFLSEYRILVGNGIVYGVGYMTGQTNVRPDDYIIKKVIELTKNNFRCVDVGLDKKTNKWIIVEINPPYSLDQYDIPLADYMMFVIDSCKWMNHKIIENN